MTPIRWGQCWSQLSRPFIGYFFIYPLVRILGLSEPSYRL